MEHLEIIGALFARSPLSYTLRIALGIVAFGAAMNVDGVVTRVIGLVWLGLTGVGMILIFVTNGTIGDLLLGIVAFGATGYAWWDTCY